ncbi:MAG TPA: class I SAM-dependent methyltransferase [bacterium]|nr:class I SAM-dependent methyltransferase [bacterium]
MDEAALFRLLDELAEFGRANDVRETERSRRLLNITPEAGRLLSILVRVLGARDILELGTSNGYSTIWLAWAASATGGHVTTVDQAPHKIAMARENLARAGLDGRVTIREGRILDVLRSLAGPVDFILLDADRPSYTGYLDPLLRLLRPGGLLATDNVVSHGSEVTEFVARLRADPALETVTPPVGSGVELTYKRKHG